VDLTAATAAAAAVCCGAGQQQQQLCCRLQQQQPSSLLLLLLGSSGCVWLSGHHLPSFAGLLAAAAVCNTPLSLECMLWPCACPCLRQSCGNGGGGGGGGGVGGGGGAAWWWWLGGWGWGGERGMGPALPQQLHGMKGEGSRPAGLVEGSGVGPSNVACTCCCVRGREGGQ